MFLLGLLENPSLLEHESFTDLLWATFHVVEELEARPSVNNLPKPDLAHITVDINRMYGRMVAECVDYAKHLKATLSSFHWWYAPTRSRRIHQLL